MIGKITNTVELCGLFNCTAAGEGVLTVLGDTLPSRFYKFGRANCLICTTDRGRLDDLRGIGFARAS